MPVNDFLEATPFDLVTQEIDKEAVEETIEQILNTSPENPGEIDEIPELDDPRWNSVNENKNEDDDLTQRAFEEVFEEAKDSVKHAENIQEILSFMGEEAKDPTLPWETVFFDLHELDESTRSELYKFSRSCKIEGEAYPQFEDYDEPICGTRNAWRSEDVEIDKKWEILVNDLYELSKGMIISKSLTKPSGRGDAPVAILWNYPTWTTTNICWSQVLDSCNPCLRMQYAKLGPNRYIRTQNKIPIRGKWSKLGANWAQYPNWEEIEAKCLQFCRWLNTRSNIIIILGRGNALTPLDRLIEMGNSLESIPVKIGCNKQFKFPDKNGSYVGAIIRMFIAKAWAKQSTENWRRTPEAAMMFGTSISNLLDPVSISKRNATVRTEEWKISDAAKSKKDGLLRAARGPKKFGAWNSRLDALFKTKQVRERVAADPQTLTAIGIHSQQRLKNLRSVSKARMTSYFKAHVIWYSKTYPKGLRFKGDGGIQPDSFPYDTVDHPAVRLHGSWGKNKRKDFQD
ncbi:hypothetical protein VN97_g10343 [Penicillium thymicola]|uniref:Uncharacterized protein n=1 Tax=Penicillium thymicola TaxID=293382 RepID=A0AAI9X3W6_PENTH|nr:hypothetical protein VN97_g10343 [Penicillium thymicola]